MTDFFKVYGLPRTGTNFTRVMISDNFEITHIRFFGYKHAAPFYQIDWTGKDWDRPFGEERPHRVAKAEEIREEVEEAVRNDRFFFVMTVKNPYAWYVSNLNSLVDSRLRIMSNWMNWYNERNWEYIHYLESKPSVSYIIRYEDYYNNIESAVSQIGDKFGLVRMSSVFKIIDEVVGPKMLLTPPPDKNGIYYHNWEWYQNRSYLKLLDKRCISHISNNVDKDIMKFFKYEVLNEM